MRWIFEKVFSEKLKGHPQMDNIFRQRRMLVPKRTSELVALMAISSTLFLFLHTRELHTKLRQMETRVQTDDLTANQVSGGSGMSAVSAMMRQLQDSGEMDSLDVSELNNTAKARKQLVFFNRVPKVGSQTFMELLRHLAIRNNFAFHRDHIQRVETIRLAPTEQLGLATMIDQYSTPSVYVKHICFLNFTHFGLPQPIYVNLVRDPVERVISWYYYVRAPWYYVERKQAFPDIPLPDPEWLKKDFETCVLRGDRECQYLEGETREGIGDHRRQSMFFCGHSEACTPFNTDGALQRAKRAVERHYAVVGVLEDLNSTFTVLEHYIPRFFAGAKQVYTELDSFRKINRNTFKPPVSEEVKDMVRRNFTREIDFYLFCRQRLHRQLLALRLPNTGT
ncbi:heparan sulfate 2-O-sulfotransferase pipe-like isoform X2 [Macrosteles quadrilineatus]|uniref:heparan sulfate 2-O-sulfotransferase pipe-like isoform X2 n=1 Tax=Macrosteles quadrilineatus TaxID=74068 RepID=UPI0023E1BB17|nr:heparan sulfate 2-O-sulfotransferase pipe-like isoform X2 [Macrosteles quadrilineatus]XP_054290439.1 heparan sulfate 2-O-sulfotransferase pipe-like isoform X2 [Macrosteles quadrilineatus]